MRVAIDIETKCNVGGCKDKQCDHALIPHLAKITCIGVWSPTFKKVFRDLEEFRLWKQSLDPKAVKLVGHNFKFDLKHLQRWGIDLRKFYWDDTQIMAAVSLDKVPKEYLEAYERLRVEENKKLPRGFSHRKVKGLSLKVLAPYFLDISPFWEDPTNHDNDEYVLKDCEYTYRLFEQFENRMKKDGTFYFYYSKMLPWTRMLLNSEIRGIRIDNELLDRMQRKAERRAKRIDDVLSRVWEKAHKVYYDLQLSELKKSYLEKANSAVLKLKSPTKHKIEKTKLRYEELFKNAAEKLEKKINYDSPPQMKWLLRDYFKLDIEVEVRDKETNEREIKDSTGSEVLHRLSLDGRKDINLFLKYRENKKLTTSFFPTYQELQYKGNIHASFNPTGTRTGRLSSSNPNLQQVPGDLHSLFVARPGYKLACFDMAAIEARLIAHYTEDPILYEFIRGGLDLHGYHTCLFFDLDCDPSEVKALHKEKRDVTKNIGFGLFYGAGYRRIQQEALKNGYKWSDRYCKHRYAKFRETYETVFQFKEAIDEMAKKGPLTNLLGRKFFFLDQGDIYMKNFNTLIQSSASDLVLESAHRIEKEFNRREIDGHCLLYVHDELVIEIPEDREEECVKIITESMTSYELNTKFGPIPLLVEGQVDRFWKK